MVVHVTVLMTLTVRRGSFDLQLIIELEYHSVYVSRALRKNANIGRCVVVAAF